MSFLSKLIASKRRRMKNPDAKPATPSRELTANILCLMLHGGKTIPQLAIAANVSQKTVNRVIEAAGKVGFEIRISKRGRVRAVLQRVGGKHAVRDV